MMIKATIVRIHDPKKCTCAHQKLFHKSHVEYLFPTVLEMWMTVDHWNNANYSQCWYYSVDKFYKLTHVEFENSTLAVGL